MNVENLKSKSRENNNSLYVQYLFILICNVHYSPNTNVQQCSFANLTPKIFDTILCTYLFAQVKAGADPGGFIRFTETRQISPTFICDIHIYADCL